MLNKKNCVACNKKVFVGDVGEIQKHLCEKHKQEYLHDRTEEIKAYLNCPVPKNIKGSITIYKKEYKAIKLPKLGALEAIENNYVK